jgi:hypothetical protein
MFATAKGRFSLGRRQRPGIKRLRLLLVFPQ